VEVLIDAEQALSCTLSIASFFLGCVGVVVFAFFSGLAPGSMVMLDPGNSRTHMVCFCGLPPATDRKSFTLLVSLSSPFPLALCSKQIRGPSGYWFFCLSFGGTEGIFFEFDSLPEVPPHTFLVRPRRGGDESISPTNFFSAFSIPPTSLAFFCTRRPRFSLPPGRVPPFSARSFKGFEVFWT